MKVKLSQKESAKAPAGAFATARLFLTEPRQYFIALAAAVGSLLTAQVAAKKIDWSGPFIWLAFVPPLLVFLHKTVPRLLRERRERILVRCSQQADATPRPTTEPLGGYFLIGPYPEERRQLFRRADGMHEIVLRWVRQSGERVLVLTGSSGTGKSSLLQAFVIPELREGAPPCTVLLLRSFEDPLAELRRRLVEPGVVWTKPPADLATLSWQELLPRALEQLRRKTPDARLVVVLDQFEELVILDPDGSGNQHVSTMREFLQDLRREAPDGFALLLSLRSDYKRFLEPLGVPLLQQGLNWQDVPAFRQGDAAEFLGAPDTGFQMPVERLNHVLTEAAAVDGARGLIRPIVLNMLGVVLRRIAGGPEADRPTRTLLADDLRRVVNESPNRELIRPMLLRMLTDADTKRPRAVGELALETGVDSHAIQGCLLDLELSGYVRPLSRPDELAARVWEVSHDFVARLLGPILKTPFQTLGHRVAAVLYPLSLAAWVLLLIGTIGWGRGQERVNAERILRDQFNFDIRMRGHSCTAKQSYPVDFGSSRLTQAIPYFSRIAPVMDLDLRDCWQLTNVDGLKELKRLETLNLNGCKSLTNVDGLKELKSLYWLDLNDCRSLTNVDGLKELKSLLGLHLMGCRVLTNADGLKELKRLETLNLSFCDRLTSVDSLKELKSLHTVDLIGCRELTSVDGLKELKSLQAIDLTLCGKLRPEEVERLRQSLPTTTITYP